MILCAVFALMPRRALRQAQHDNAHLKLFQLCKCFLHALHSLLKVGIGSSV